MKHLITIGYILFAISMPIFIIVEDAIAEQVNDHRDTQPKVHDHRDTQRQQEKVPARRGSTNYKVSWLKPTKIPADLESWLNRRMRGYALVAVTRDDSSGRYNSFFKKLPKGSWNYKVKVVPESSIEKVLNEAPTQGLRLVAITSARHGPRGLQYICFFRQL